MVVKCCHRVIFLLTLSFFLLSLQKLDKKLHTVYFSVDKLACQQKQLILIMMMLLSILSFYSNVVDVQVADCICLMSLDKMEAVPVDTHVWQLAVREYRLSGLSNSKSLTDAIYKQIGMRHLLLLLN